MSDFMSPSTAMTICKTDASGAFDLDALRAHAFTPDIDADGKRLGGVSLGDLLDTDGFELASVDGRYSGFSFRLDARKTSGAVIRLQLAEVVREELAAGKKGGGKRKKELKEAITAKVTAKAEFVPSPIVFGTWKRGGFLWLQLPPKPFSRYLTCSRRASALTPRPSHPPETCRNSFRPSSGTRAIPALATRFMRWVPPAWPRPNRPRKNPPWPCRTA